MPTTSPTVNKLYRHDTYSRMNRIHLRDHDIQEIRNKCAWARNATSWKNNADLGNSDLDMALEFARNGLDGGLLAAEKLEPTDNDHHNWMKYAYLLTIYYNSGREEKRYTILRLGLYFKHKKTPAC